MSNATAAHSCKAHIESLQHKHQQLEESLKSQELSVSSADVDLKMLKQQKLYIKDEIEQTRKKLAQVSAH